MEVDEKKVGELKISTFLKVLSSQYQKDLWTYLGPKTIYEFFGLSIVFVLVVLEQDLHLQDRKVINQ